MIMSVYIRPFKISDLDAFVPIEPMVQSIEVDLEMAKAIEDSGLAVTGIRNGKIWGCGGVHPTGNEEQGELWLRLSRNCLKHKLDTLRWLREGLKIIEETYPFKQLNTIIRCDFKASIKLVKFLGFHETQVMTDNNKKWSIFSKRVKE